MEFQERILAKADIRKVSNKKRKIIKIVYLFFLASSLILGIISGTHIEHFEQSIIGPAHDNIDIGWFGVELFYKAEGLHGLGSGYSYWGDFSNTYTVNIICLSAMYIIFLAAPLYIDAIHKRQCQNTALTISESRVYGSYNSFLFKKSLEIPIDKIDNLTSISSLMDKLRTGMTLGVCSASGVIKIHFVQNAEEVISATINRIDEIKDKEERSLVFTQTIENAYASTSDKLKDLLAMKESGLITEEEFKNKREDILSNM